MTERGLTASGESEFGSLSQQLFFPEIVVEESKPWVQGQSRFRQGNRISLFYFTQAVNVLTREIPKLTKGM